MTGDPVLPLTLNQCRRARELLGWNMPDLAEASGVGMVALMKLEDRKKPPPTAKVAKVRQAFEAAGIEFIPGAARLRDQPSAEEAILPGPAGEIA